jgi:DNA-binding transcriptional ArsR family regulator
MSLGDGSSRTARLRATAHPVRLRILSLLTAADLTAAEVARELALTHANASYHLRQLLAAGIIEVAGSERIRGGSAKRYRYDVERDLGRPPSVPEVGAPSEDDQLLYVALASELQRRAGQLRRGPGNFLTDAEFWVDPQTWLEIRDEMAGASARLHRAAQAPRSPGAVRVSATVALFQLVEDD